MKYFAFVILIAVVVFVSCKKTNSTTTSVLFYNGTWSLDAITAAWNGGSIIASPLAQGQSSVKADSAYIQVPAGTNLITVKAGSTTLLDKNIYSMAAAGSSFIFFDTSTATAPVRIMQLTDDLSLPDTGTFKYRIINLVPDTGVKADIWLVNGVTDSVRLDSANFRRSLLSDAGWVIPTGRRAQPGSSGGKPAELFRAGRMWMHGGPIRHPQAGEPSRRRQ